MENKRQERLKELVEILFKKIDHLTGGEMFSSGFNKKPEVVELEKIYNEIEDIFKKEDD